MAIASALGGGDRDGPAGFGSGRRRRCWRPGSCRRSSRFWSAGRGRRGRRRSRTAETNALRRVARKTWLFFETFVGDDDHWLPPDNFQEVPDGRVAHRTSPTNQGLLLLSTLAAHDLGYLGLSALADRLEKTFDTFDRMEKHWGHFYNWYNTQTLQVLPPAYISTVDSGNLLGCLVALKQGLKEKAAAPLDRPGGRGAGSGRHARPRRRSAATGSTLTGPAPRRDARRPARAGTTGSAGSTGRSSS